MFDYKSVLPDNQLQYKFKCDPSDSNIINAYDIDTPILDSPFYIKGVIHLDTGEASSDEIREQYDFWMSRPERKVGQKVDIEGKNASEIMAIYEELFVGAYILQRNLKIESGVTQPYERALDWLRSTDFYTAPASHSYHEAYPSGLLVHSLNVYNQMVSLIKTDAFKSVNVYEATIVALVHDWCKINYYECYMRNVKDEKTGQWEQVPAYRTNQKGIPMGHGATSMYLANRIINLTIEQALAIRWHQGEYNVCTYEDHELGKANTEFPMVYLIQFADRLACTQYAN